MRLHNLVKSEGASRPKKRLGRGEGSGRGKTSGRGNKGQHARAGSSIRPGFESGHVPLYRKLPKRGFNQARFRSTWSIVNLGALAALPEEVSDVDRKALVDAGLIRDNDDLIKVLGDGEVTRALTVRAHKFSATAKEKIEKAGGQAIVLAKQADETEGQA